MNRAGANCERSRCRYRAREKEKVEEQNKLIARKNKDITDSIHYARRILHAILPIKEKITELLPEAFILFKPKDIVSGDFYWFHQNNGKVIIAAVDCTGHGVPGAFMSMIGNDLLNQIVIKKCINIESNQFVIATVSVFLENIFQK